MKIILTLIFLFVLPFVFAGTQIISTIIVPPNISLNLGSTQSVNCTATITDTETWESIIAVNATIWDTISSAENSADDNNNHYTNTSCTLGDNDTLNSRPVTCGFSLQYYSNPSTWTCKIRSYNSTSDSASNETNVTVNSLVSLEVTESAINFGTLNLGNTSQEDVNSTITNTGNIIMDVGLSGNALSCSSGSISVGNIRYSSLSGTAYNSMVSLTGIAKTLVMALDKSTGPASTGLIYWKISIPSSGVGGTCTNTITFTAKSG